MRMIVLGLVLLVAVTPALGQTAAPRQQRDEDSRTDHPKAGDLLWPAIKLLQDAKRRADEEKRRKEEEAQTPPAEPPDEPAPVAVTPTQETPAPPIVHKPRVPSHTVRVIVVPKPRPDLPDPVITPAEAAQPVQNAQPVATSPPAELHPAPNPPLAPAATPLPTNADRAWPIGSWGIAVGLLLLLLAAAYAARRILFPGGPLPKVRAQVDAGSVSAPLFDEALPSMSLMIGAGALVTASDYPFGAS